MGKTIQQYAEELAGAQIIRQSLSSHTRTKLAMRWKDALQKVYNNQEFFRKSSDGRNKIKPFFQCEEKFVAFLSENPIYPQQKE